MKEAGNYSDYDTIPNDKGIHGTTAQICGIPSYYELFKYVMSR